MPRTVMMGNMKVPPCEVCSSGKTRSSSSVEVICLSSSCSRSATLTEAAILSMVSPRLLAETTMEGSSVTGVSLDTAFCACAAAVPRQASAMASGRGLKTHNIG